MKALLLIGFLVFSSILFISATKKTYHPELARDEAFTQSISSVSSLKAIVYTGDKVQFDNEFRKLARSMALLQEKYPDLSNTTSATSAINHALDNLNGESRTAVHGDTCLRPFIHAVFACFRTCTNHTALKACLTAACTSYQDCKDGGPRR
jgi:hypothetical protein